MATKIVERCTEPVEV